MPRRYLKLTVGEYYHFYNRGNNREHIFSERENYLFFLRQLRKYLLPSAEVTAYCLMPNHYHLILLLKESNISHQMQLFSISYTKAFNKRYSRTGSLFEGAFKSKHIDKDSYLLHLSRYIHLNPVRAGLVRKPEDWEYSSYQDYIGIRNGTLPSRKTVMSLMKTSEVSETSEVLYRKFVESYLEDDKKIIKNFLFE